MSLPERNLVAKEVEQHLLDSLTPAVSWLTEILYSTNLFVMVARTVLVSALLSAGALAQPSFEVASVKQGGPVRPDGLLDINLGNAIHGTVTLSNTTLSECIRYAYGLANEQQIAGPDWIRDRSYRFEIVAKAPPDTPIDQLRLMLQTLLKERFRLEIHHEQRKLAHLDLTIDKNGPKMPLSSGDGPGVRHYYGSGRLSYTGVPMDRFAVLLSRVLKEPVFDKTGLDGVYDLELNWMPDDASANADAGAKPDIFTAVEQQLGLKLAISKAPVDVLVVDNADKTPVSN
jgi:uncharacterized protein (TIGR03435 family)